MAGAPVTAATDGSEASLRAVEWAAREAVLRGTQLRIVSVPALPPRLAWQRGMPGAPDAVADLVHESYQRALELAATRAAEVEPGLTVHTALLSGPPAWALAERMPDAAMLVVGSRGAGGLGAMVLGSVSRYLADHPPCPVVIAREETMAAHRRVVVGIRDLDHPSALAFAFEEARFRKADLHVLHAWHWFVPAGPAGPGSAWPRADAGEVTAAATRWLSDELAGWRAEYPGVQVVTDIAHGPAGRVLAGASARADLIVLGRGGAASAGRAPGDPETNADPGRAGAGAVTHAVLHHAHCPVAIIPGRPARRVMRS